MSPDQYAFDHLTNWGVSYHRCIVDGCGFPDPPRVVQEEERKKHAAMHERERAAESERKRNEALALARKVKRQKQREDALLKERYDK